MSIKRIFNGTVNPYAQPVQGDAHGRMSRPIEFAGRGQFKVDGQIAQPDRMQPAISMHDVLSRHSMGIIDGGHAID